MRVIVCDRDITTTDILDWQFLDISNKPKPKETKKIQALLSPRSFSETGQVLGVTTSGDEGISEPRGTGLARYIHMQRWPIRARA